MSKQSAASMRAHDSHRAPSGVVKLRLWAEMLVLFVGIPLAMAFLMSRSQFTPALIAISVIGITLLAITPGFRWRSLITGKVLAHWRLILFFTVACVVVLSLTLWMTSPHSFFGLISARPDIWITVMLFYPVLLVTPQELVFRALFFERYGVLFGDRWIAIFVNSVFFGLAHLFYWNWPAVVLTFLGNFVIAYGYLEKKSFPLAMVLHAISGMLVFTIGLGRYFYHGMIGN